MGARDTHSKMIEERERNRSEIGLGDVEKGVEGKGGQGAIYWC
jgi:hypothetical protein